MALFGPGKPTEHIGIFGSDEIADVTGAGDTVIATMTLAVAVSIFTRRRASRTMLAPADEARHRDGDR
jgi:bifunctional ADP-heptose synthase (sugar kinase/adenylyltransferase)